MFFSPENSTQNTNSTEFWINTRFFLPLPLFLPPLLGEGGVQHGVGSTIISMTVGTVVDGQE